jgi:hypothetical protein
MAHCLVTFAGSWIAEAPGSTPASRERIGGYRGHRANAPLPS